MERGNGRGGGGVNGKGEEGWMERRKGRGGEGEMK